MAIGTITTFAMPSLGADMDEGRITEWLVRPGDHVERGQIVVIVETDKSDIEVEVFEPATVVELLVAEDERVAVGTPIATMRPDSGADAAPAPTPPETPATSPPTSTLPTAARRRTAPAGAVARAPVGAPTSPPIGAPTRSPTRAAEPPVTSVVTSPVLRHLAEDLHVDPSTLHGSGPGGRVHRADIEQAAQRTRRRITPRARKLIEERGVDVERFGPHALVTGADVLAVTASAAPRGERDGERAANRQATMRRHIADLMKRSWHEIPHYHVTKRLDLTVLTERLAVVNEDRPLAERIVPGALLLCAAARAAAKVGECNGWWHGGRFEPADHVDLGVVLSLRTGGIIVPTIGGADRLSPAEMMDRLGELVQQARQGRLRSSHLGEATITVTSLGDRGGDAVYGVIHPPQVALVGFGAPHDDIWPDGEGGVNVRPTVVATLSGDHRATDGLAASRFLAQVQSLLERTLPAELELEEI